MIQYHTSLSASPDSTPRVLFRKGTITQWCTIEMLADSNEYLIGTGKQIVICVRWYSYHDSQGNL